MLKRARVWKVTWSTVYCNKVSLIIFLKYFRAFLSKPLHGERFLLQKEKMKSISWLLIITRFFQTNWESVTNILLAKDLWMDRWPPASIWIGRQHISQKIGQVVYTHSDVQVFVDFADKIDLILIWFRARIRNWEYFLVLYSQCHVVEVGDYH